MKAPPLIVIPAVGIVGLAIVALVGRRGSNSSSKSPMTSSKDDTPVSQTTPTMNRPRSQTQAPTAAPPRQDNSTSAPFLIEEGIEGRGYVANRVTQDGRTIPHWGQDIGAPIGTPVYAAKDGEVIRTGARSGYGNCLEITHSNGVESSVYAHLDRILVSVGDRVRAGDRVALVGRTTAGADGVAPSWGATMGSHIHFEVHPRAVPVFGTFTQRTDPGRWLRQNEIAFYRTRRRPPW